MNINYTRYYHNWHDGSLEDSIKISKSYYRDIDSLALPKDARILDLGCGMGSFLIATRDRGYLNAHGIDVSAEQIKVARQHGLPAEHVINSQAWLAERVSVYDAIFLYDVLEHIPAKDQIFFLARIHDSLKPDGVLFVRTPNANSTFAGRYRWGDWTHSSVFTEHSLDFVLFNAGFSDIKIRQDNPSRYPIWIPRPSLMGLLRAVYFVIRRLQAIAEFGSFQGMKIPITINIVGVARKSGIFQWQSTKGASPQSTS